MDRKFALLLLTILCSAQASLASSDETVLMVPGGRYNFSAGKSAYTILLVGLTRETATFVISGARVSPDINETKVVDLNNDGVGDVRITLNSILPNSTADLTLSQQAQGRACKQINDRCIGLYECCVGECVQGICNYPLTAVNATVNVNLNVPSKVTTGGIVTLKITRDDGSPVADAVVDVILPTLSRLTLTTNESGEGIYLADEAGNYTYTVYGYLQNSNRTTVSGEAAPPPQEKPAPKAQTKPCGDKVCSMDENCSSCPSDCGACPVPAPAEEKTQNIWFVWPILMFLVIILILRVLLPLFVREE